MKTTISSKLLLGFLLVIFLNVLFVVVVSRFADLYGLSRVLGWQNDTKTGLLRIASLHGTQRTSVVILDKLGREASYEHFKSIAGDIDTQIDSIVGHLNAITSNTLPNKILLNG